MRVRTVAGCHPALTWAGAANEWGERVPSRSMESR